MSMADAPPRAARSDMDTLGPGASKGAGAKAVAVATQAKPCTQLRILLIARLSALKYPI